MMIDLAVTMPSNIFQGKDYLNYRYFHKRAFYLACVATGIEEAEESSFTMDFALQNDSELQPVIIVNPGQASDDFSKSKFKIRIILAASRDLFLFSKTLPNKNAIRSKVGNDSLENLPTPFYNASIRSECSSLAYEKYLEQASMQSEGYVDACILGCVWLRQRGLGRGGFGAFEWSSAIALLMQSGGLGGKPVLSKGYSSYQLFKAMLQYLAANDLVMSPVFSRTDGIQVASSDGPILFDGMTGINVLYKMTPCSYALLRHEANHTLKMLGSPVSNQFDSCFISKIEDRLYRFDCVISLPLHHLLSSASKGLDAISDSAAYCKKLYQVLKTGLGDRTQLIYLEDRSASAWLPTSQKPVETGKDHIDIGLLLNPEQINRTVDRGPSVEDKEAASAYRKFWGDKAQLRRYNDGIIQESLLWSSSGFQDSVQKQVVTYIVRQHFGPEVAEKLSFVGDSFDCILPTHNRANTDPVTLYQRVMSAFDIMEKDLRALEGLPLQIRQISASDPQLRYASVKVPILDSIQCDMDPAGVCVQFEGSSRWPDDLSAVQRTKIAFLLKIGELLEESTTGLTAQVGLSNVHNRLLNAAFLDILYPSGAFFRLTIHHERELDLLERTLKGEAQTAASRETVASALSTYKRSFIQAPRHTQAVRILSTRFPLLSSSMRLMKHWRNSHLLSSHVSDELIELLTIRTFVHPYPWSVPGSIMTGFLRTLIFIAKWDWRSEPLIVDFNSEMTSQDLDAIRLRFEAWRRIDLAMNRIAMFAASNVDRDGVTWTEPGPSKVVAARFTSLAKAACKFVNEQGMRLEPGRLFAASIEDYDFVIHLNPKYTKGRQQAGLKKPPEFKNLQIEASDGKRSLVGYNPVQSYLDELRTLYSSNVLFFSDEQGGSIIAGLWNPQTGSRPWKVNLQYSTLPLLPSMNGEGESQVEINKTATLHEISRLGDEMILRIDIKN